MNASSIASYDVVIVGGGIVGSLFACALGGSALKVALIERQRPVDVAAGAYDVRVSALTLASRTMLESVGAWSGIAQRRFAVVSSMRVWDAGASGEIRFDSYDIGEPALAYVVENSVVVAALHDRLAQFTNVHVLAGASIANVSMNERAEVSLADGRRLSAGLLVGADGADSALRQQLNIPMQQLDMSQQAIVATVRTALPHQATAWQRFLPTGPLAFLPLAAPNVCSIVWSADKAYANSLMALTDDAFADALQRSLESRLGPVELIGPRHAFPLALSHTTRYAGERFALIGDAAHTVHPLAGQGVNLGMLDAAALAEVVLDAVPAKRDVGATHVLRRYERWRKGDNLAMVAITGGFKLLFGNDWPGVRQLRGFGLAATDAVTPVKNFIIRRASGLVGDLPRLARRNAR